MLLAVISILLLIGNWFFSESLVLIPIDLIIRFGNGIWWGLGFIIVIFLAWCVGDD
ncbi:MAG: hypothetical protein AAF383_10255 [Cyanobacteria bacterium P01_A01_bin.83]